MNIKQDINKNSTTPAGDFNTNNTSTISTNNNSNNKSERMRIFVALFDYDPPTMSPNPDACDEELPFREGQLIKVYGEKDGDGFYGVKPGQDLVLFPATWCLKFRLMMREWQRNCFVNKQEVLLLRKLIELDQWREMSDGLISTKTCLSRGRSHSTTMIPPSSAPTLIAR